MRKEQAKRDYSAPSCMIIQMNETTNLMDTSFPTTQHRPGHHGGTISSAKSSMPWEDEDEDEDEENPSWED